MCIVKVDCSNIFIFLNCRLITNGQGKVVVDLIKQTTRENRAPRYGPLLYALALCAKSKDKATKNAAFRSLAEVCRLPTHLFQFIKFADILSGSHKGWGRAQRKGVSEWYNQKHFLDNPLKLLHLGCKYRRRNTFSHKDVIRLGHVKPANPHVAFAIRYFVKGKKYLGDFRKTEDIALNLAYQYVLALEKTRKVSTNDTVQLCKLIKEHRFSHEHIPTTHLGSKEVWESLVSTMPLTALIRHLGKLSALGLLNPGEPKEDYVFNKLCSQTGVQSTKMHPFILLTAWNSYKRGFSGPADHKRSVWEINPRIANALETAFYNSLSNVRPTGGRLLLAVDGSEAMLHRPAHGMPEVSARSAAVALVLAISKIEAQAHRTGNVETVLLLDTVRPIVINTQRDNDIESASQRFSVEGTTSNLDPGRAIQFVDWALENEKTFDAFVLFTISGTPIVDVARRYREQMSTPHCRFVNVVMTSIDYNVTDPHDQNMLNVIGLDSKAVSLILDFIRNGISE